MARTNSNAFRVTVVNQQLPVWRSGQAIGEWREIAGSSMSLAPSYLYGATNEPGGKVVAWAGYSIDTRNSKIYSVANGGHADYYGNEVDVINLEADAPVWTEILTASPQSAITQGASNPYNTDGRPNSRHQYFYNVFVESLNGGRSMIFGGGSYSTVGNGGPNVDGFNPATNTFDLSGTYPNIVSAYPSVPNTGQNPVNAVSKHPTTEDVYYWAANYYVWKWVKSLNAWSLANTEVITVTAGNACSAIDPTRGTAGRMLVIGPNVAFGACNYFDIGTGTFSTVTLSGALAPEVRSSYLGLIYHPVLDRFLLRTPAAGGLVYSIHPTTGAVEEFVTTGGTNLPAALNSVLTRWLYVPRLGGVFYGPGYLPNQWFLRTH